MNTPLNRRRAALVVALGLASAAAFAQGDVAAFPNKPVTLTTAFAAGSGPDAVLRQVGDKLSRLWGQPVLINNRPGGGGFIAIEAVRRLPADGYNLLQLDSEHLAALPLLYKSRNFNTLDHFDPVAILFRTPFLVAVSTESKWKDMKDLIAAAKANPGKVTFGSWGVGSPGHLAGEQLELQAGLDMSHVAYREVSQLYTSVASEEPAWSMGSIPSSQGMFKAGKIRYIAVAAPKRIPQMPDVPTVQEAGGPANFDINSFVPLVAPKGIAPELANKINADVQKVLADPEVRAKFDTFAFEPLKWSPDEIRKQAEAKGKVYEQLVKRKNISLD
jgi:tripartite-type tricarboxylate transporter receptor subunit TctC